MRGHLTMSVESLLNKLLKNRYKEKTSTETEDIKHEATVARIKENYVLEPTSPPRFKSKSSTVPKLATIKAILNSFDALPQPWPKEAFRAILRRYERMPRKG